MGLTSLAQRKLRECADVLTLESTSKFEIDSFRGTSPEILFLLAMTFVTLMRFKGTMGGQISNIHGGWLGKRQLQIMSTQQSCYFMTTIAYPVIFLFVCVLPILTLGVLAVNFSTLESWTVPLRLSIIILAVFLVCFSLTDIYFKHYRISTLNSAMFAVAYALMITLASEIVFQWDITAPEATEQSVPVAVDPKQMFTQFFLYSAFYLSLNSLVPILVCILYGRSKFSSIQNLIDSLFDSEDKEVAEAESYDQVMAQIQENRDSVDYKPSEKEFKQVASIFTLSMSERPANIGSSFKSKFADLHLVTKALICLVGLAIYGLTFNMLGKQIVTEFDSNHGYFNVIVIFVLDVVIALLSSADIIESRYFMVMSITVTRIVISFFGFVDWVKAYYLLYFFFGLVIAAKIGSLRVPFASQEKMKSVTKFENDDDYKPLEENSNGFLDALTAPELAQIVLSLSFAGFMNILGGLEGENEVAKGIVSFLGVELTFFAVSLYCIALLCLLTLSYVNLRQLYKYFCDYPDGSSAATSEQANKLFIFPMVTFMTICILMSAYLYSVFKHVNFLYIGLGLPVIFTLFMYEMKLFKDNNFEYSVTPTNENGEKEEGEKTLHMQLLSFMIGILILSCVLMFLVNGSTEFFNLFGVSVFAPAIYLMITFAIVIRNQAKGLDMVSLIESVGMVLAFLLQLAAGWFTFKANFDVDKLIANAETGAEATEQDKELDFDAVLYLCLYVVLIPTATMVVATVSKIFDDQGKISKFSFFGFLVSLIGSLVLAQTFFVTVSFNAGLIANAVCIVVCYVALQIGLFIDNGFKLSKLWTLVNGLIFLAFVAAPIFGVVKYDLFDFFTGLSMQLWIIAGTVLVYALQGLLQDYKGIKKNPVFVSPTIFPIYKYNSTKNQLESRTGSVSALIGGFSILQFQAILSVFLLQPQWVGVFLFIVESITLLIILLAYIDSTGEEIEETYEFMTQKVVKEAWLGTLQSLYQNLSEGTQGQSDAAIFKNQIVTFAKITEQLNDLEKVIDSMEGGETNVEQKEEVDKWIDTDNLKVETLCDMKLVMLYAQEQLNDAFYDEVHFIVMLVLTLIRMSHEQKFADQKFLTNFIINKAKELKDAGIEIADPQFGTVQQRYLSLIEQIEALPVDQNQQFKDMIEEHIKLQNAEYARVIELKRQQEEAQRKRDEEIRRREEEYQAKLDEMYRQQQEKKGEDYNPGDELNEEDIDMEIEEMPDCLFKYQRIVKRYKEDSSYKFIDPQFTPSYDSIGRPDAVVKYGYDLSEWKSGCDIPGAQLFVDDVGITDVQQGVLGDCYFLAALHVVPGPILQNEVIITIDHKEEWRNHGAFCVKFYMNGQERYVIVDDNFPCFRGDFAFVKAGSDGRELWPMVMEKAYAKLYGSYGNIEGGFTECALSEMLNGPPTKFYTKLGRQHGMDYMFNKMKQHVDRKDFLGASTPANEHGDKARSMGICQQHAYALLNVVEVDGLKLVQLRNPHGIGGDEWYGDYGDKSTLWTEKLRNKVKFENKDDGIFWMDIHDFCEQYEDVNVCSNLTKQQGWFSDAIHGKWDANRCGGVNGNRSENIPQYFIHINSPGLIYVMVVMKERKKRNYGDQGLFVNISDLDGETYKGQGHFREGLAQEFIGMAYFCKAIELDKNMKYPLKLTMAVANENRGQQGSFYISAHAKDYVKVEAAN